MFSTTWIDRLLKQMKWYDISLIKGAVFFATLFLVKAVAGFLCIGQQHRLVSAVDYPIRHACVVEDVQRSLSGSLRNFLLSLNSPV